MLNTSLLAPLTSTATGLPQFDDLAESSRHHEALEKSLIDDHERFAAASWPWATAGSATSTRDGRRHSEEVDCVYAPAVQLAIEV